MPGFCISRVTQGLPSNYERVLNIPPEEKEISLELTLPQEKIEKLVQDMHLSDEESDHGWDEE